MGLPAERVESFGAFCDRLGLSRLARAAFEAAADLAGNRREQDLLKRRAIEAANAATASP